MSVRLNLLFPSVSTVYASLNGFPFFNWKMINNETDRNALSALQRQLKVEKNFVYIATKDRSHDLIFDNPLYYPLF